MTILVTGTRSGLGRTVHRTLGGIPLSRDTLFAYLENTAPFDAIVHCAVNSAKDVPLERAEAYLDDNVGLTRRLVALPHRRFVHVSSIDVQRPLQSLYAATKALSETIVGQYAAKPLILRPTSLLGTHMRPNTIYRMLTERNCKVFPASTSKYNFVLNDDVAALIGRALADGITGMLDVASSYTIDLSTIANELKLNVMFGDYVYTAPPADNADAARLCPALACNSRDAVNRLIDQLGEKFVGRGRL